MSETRETNNRSWIPIMALAIGIIVLMFGDNLVERLTGCSISDILYKSCLTSNTSSTSQVVPAGVWTDNFDNSVLNNDWLWLGEDSTHWSLNAQPGFLRIITTSNSSVGAPVNLLIKSAPTNNYSIRTRVSFKPTQPAHFAGLLIMLDSENFLKLGRAFYSDTDNGIALTLKDHGEWSGPVIVGTWDDVYLQIERNGSEYIGYYSLNGQDWKFIGTLTPTFLPPYIGLIAIDGYGNADELPADFDYFEVNEN